MSTNLSDFIQHIKKNSIARTNRFRIMFTLPTQVQALANFIGKDDIAKTISLTCMMAGVPSNAAQTTEVSYGNYNRRVVFGRVMGDFTTTFLVTGKYAEKKLFDIWASLLNDENNHAVNFYDDYITNIQVECLNERDEVVYRFELTETYPITVGQLRLDRTAQNQQMVLDVNWAFHKVNTIVDNVNAAPGSTGGQIPTGAPTNGKKRLLEIPGVDQMSSAVRSATETVKEFRGQLDGVLKIAKDVREQVRDFKMSAVDGVKTLNGVVKDVKAIKNIPADVKNEVIAVVNDTKNQIGFLKNDVANISKYPQR